MSLNRSMSKRKPVFGLGINDADYVVTGCPYYKKWTNMLMRCYCKTYLYKNHSYAGSSVCEEWLRFTSFRDWLVSNNYNLEDEIDKDILSSFGKVYSPDTCCLIPKTVNSFICKISKTGDLPKGVHYCNRDNIYVSQIRDKGKKIRLGSFDCPEIAHVVWLNKKLELALPLSLEIQNTKVRDKFLDLFRFGGFNDKR